MSIYVHIIFKQSWKIMRFFSILPTNRYVAIIRCGPYKKSFLLVDKRREGMHYIRETRDMWATLMNHPCGKVLNIQNFWLCQTKKNLARVSVVKISHVRTSVLALGYLNFPMKFFELLVQFLKKWLVFSIVWPPYILNAGVFSCCFFRVNVLKTIFQVKRLSGW